MVAPNAWFSTNLIMTRFASFCPHGVRIQAERLNQLVTTELVFYEVNDNHHIVQANIRMARKGHTH